MKKLLALASLAGLLLAGCTNNDRNKPAVPKAEVKKASSANDPRRLGFDVLRQASEIGHFRDALHLLNADFQSSEMGGKLLLGEEARKELQTTVGLTDDELQEVESVAFRPADAYHLAERFLFRDAARALEVAGLDRPEQARHVFDWVTRHVLLNDTGDDWLPPDFVLRRGHGDARDRALVFLALLRQMQIDGVLLVRPEPTPEVVLVGVPGEDKQQLYLFDPRLGLPVLTEAGKVATLDEARANPDLLKPSRLTAEQLQALEARLVVPLYALSPRMRELERLLTSQERVVLHLDPARYARDVASAVGDLKVQVWNAPGKEDRAENSPTRALRRFLPADEGGTDPDARGGNRLKKHAAQLVPWTPVLLGYEQVRLGQSQLAGPGYERLLHVTSDLLTKFYVQPHEYLLRGQYDRAVARLDRLRTFLDDDSLIGLAESGAFHKDVADWRDRLNKAALEQLKNPQAQGALNAVLADDQYILSVLQLDGDDRPEMQKKKALTRILAHATRDPLGQRAAWLQALAWQERAEKAQAFLDQVTPDNKATLAAARNAWFNAKISWNRYLDRANLSPSAVRQRLEPIRRLFQSGDEASAALGLGLLQQLHLDLLHYYAAKVRLAEALRHTDNAQAARASLQNTAAELARLRGGDDGKGGMRHELGELQRDAPATQRALAQMLEQLTRAWDEQGTYDWLHAHVQKQLEFWKQG